MNKQVYEVIHCRHVQKSLKYIDLNLILHPGPPGPPPHGAPGPQMAPTFTAMPTVARFAKRGWVSWFGAFPGPKANMGVGLVWFGWLVGA